MHRSDQAEATRAITDSGISIWMVRLRGKRFVYHSDREGVDDAVRQAAEARRAVAAR